MHTLLDTFQKFCRREIKDFWCDKDQARIIILYNRIEHSARISQTRHGQREGLIRIKFVKYRTSL